MEGQNQIPILCVVGARPNFMKIAPIMRVFNREDNNFSAKLLHTGQHYDQSMKVSFFDQLNIPEPDIDLGVGSGTHAVQTAEVMKKFEPVLDTIQPKMVLVVGDVNSTLACALVAVKKGVPVIHVEAGLRSNDRSMPEEINRILTDQISDLLFITEESARQNLVKEGVCEHKIHFVGNVMIDTLLHNLECATPVESILTNVNNRFKEYGLVTLHRPSNVDDPKVLSSLVETLLNISKDLKLVFPVHPRTLKQLQLYDLLQVLEQSDIQMLPPLGYLEMLGLMRSAKVVLTDSGGIQEETTALGVPCITLRDSTERPITLTEGTNVLVGSNPKCIREAFDSVITTGGKSGRIPEFWDGRAAERIVEVIHEWVRQAKI
ncbi:UDP-N-acetylglucosamine 2-epimerase (non-hydrolyzing) [Aestuariicella hydrocarbonica]|uniref:UDP-N-acetylglucosamine 2-epimerase (Non-hydrolyzing) n=1 Tax=Pseudomaricurvus hydrocarbonicus TaxID=1470433 RepID=A0A9E5JYS1_9GAMM|nr:UDP-N-acetylglucosamine 2-epimerase (non-hydrolyzing) [Aestuariicella hydrocarbonica]NHO64697.1 UDP-N-acetylglucosamine 2-epimerase (non-hydrolyzing) [Aestuariicella hydrocarbonica]